jgi:hypothetical protein
MGDGSPNTNLQDLLAEEEDAIAMSDVSSASQLSGGSFASRRFSAGSSM